MRAVFIALVPATALIAAPQPVAAAYDLPWCAQFYTLGQVKSCAYATYEACAATIRGVGGVCTRNPRYPAGPIAVQPLRRKPRP